jgi:LysR family hydrogen peroxide-inducible transcriptional activator
MEIKQLQSLLAIADHGSFSAAARALDTVQSNVSAHISRLEKELGTVLVDRHHGVLTDEGDMVAARARRIVHELEDIDSDIHSLGDSAVGDSRIGTIGTTARWLMPRLLPTLGRTHPGVRMTVVESATSSLVPLLNAGEIDAAIIHLPVEGDHEVREMFAESLLLVCNNNHPLAERSEISIVELAEHPILLAPSGTAQRRILDRAAATHGVSLRSQAEIDGVRLMTSLAFEGFGAAIVPASAIPGWLQGPFVRITVPELPRRVVGWVQRARPRPNRATLAVRDVALGIVQKHGDRQPGVTVNVGVAAGRGPRQASPA